jgi:methionyl-tRNA formyltransferase
VNGEQETGATLHEMVAKADAGRIVDQQAVPILPDDTGRQVFDKVTVAAEQVLWRSLPAIVAGEIRFRPNDVAAGSYFGRRTPEDGRIDWSQPAARVYDLVRAVAPPYPGAFTELAGVTLVIATARLAVDTPATAKPPGLRVVDGRIIAVCGDGRGIEIRELRSAGEPVATDRLTELLAAHRVAQERS